MRKTGILFAGMAVVILLSGCGRHKDNKDAGGTTPTPTTAEFTGFVKGLFAKTSDTDEPVDIEAVTFTSAETDDETAFDSLLQ